MKTLNCIGCGKVGRTLARLWQEAHVFEIQDVLTRSENSAKQAIDFIGQGNAVHECAALRYADVMMIATKDEAISQVVETLVAVRKIRKGMVVFHTSGAFSSHVLQLASQQGAITASAHPLMSFASPELSVASFPGCYCCIEGQREACALLEKAFQAIGGQTFSITSENKTLYHAASVFASNYMVTLMEAALQAYEASGVERSLAEKLVNSLVNTVVKNVGALGTRAALTGPLSRGEHSIVEKHCQALAAWKKEMGSFYQKTAELTAQLFGLP